MPVRCIGVGEMLTCKNAVTRGASIESLFSLPLLAFVLLSFLRYSCFEFCFLCCFFCVCAYILSVDLSIVFVCFALVIRPDHALCV